MPRTTAVTPRTARRAFVALGFGAIAALSGHAAHAASPTSIVVPANRTTEVGFLNVYDTHGCAYGARPRVRLKPPSHGRITTRWQRRPITTNRFGLGGEKCVGRDMYGLAVFYTPEPGFRGEDSYKLRWTYRTNTGARGFLGGTTHVRVR